jgi:hypothetical protein
VYFAVSHLDGYYPKWLDQYAEFRKAPGDVLCRLVWKEHQPQTSPTP